MRVFAASSLVAWLDTSVISTWNMSSCPWNDNLSSLACVASPHSGALVSPVSYLVVLGSEATAPDGASSLVDQLLVMTLYLEFLWRMSDCLLIVGELFNWSSLWRNSECSTVHLHCRLNKNTSRAELLSLVWYYRKYNEAVTITSVRLWSVIEHSIIEPKH